MHRFVPIFCFLTAGNISLSAQNPIPILQDEALWYMVEDEVVFVQPGSPQDSFRYDTAAYVYWLGGDTLLPHGAGQHLYRKVYRAYQPEDIFNDTASDFFAGAREENGQLWVNEGNYEKLSFDGNLVVGDTLFYGSVELESALVTVEFIDTVVLSDGLKRRQWDFRVVEFFQNFFDTSYWYDYWLEGVGSLGHCTFYPATCIFAYQSYFNPTQHFNCYSLEDNFLIYGYFHEVDCFQYFTSTPEPLPQPAISMEIFPNPASDQLQVRFKPREANFSIWQFRVYNYQGGEMTSYQMQQHEQEFTIDSRTWPAGIYYLVATGSSGDSKMWKLAVQR
ncbi:MAG: T9SS type A sorting domain-containing protein [Saprospiraceae bacterium]|nr:T9SS type A sorting domain-containing protein [Saprospiraceae bacterium]MCB0682548.1 T9SS type A sorting domain-containing protein [Saprospiraceae bacterium]